MFNVANFLEKFKLIYKNESDKKGQVIVAIQKVVSVNLKPDNLSIKDGILRVNASPLIRNEINMRKESLLSELSKKELGIVDIK